MNIGLLSILHTKEWDFRPDMAQTYANALKNAVEMRIDNDIEKQHGFFLSKKGYKDKETGRTVGANFEDKMYVGNIYRVEDHLYWNDEELSDDDQIIDVVVVDGPVTRDGGGCSYGSKDWRDQVMYANTIPQVVGHVFVINTPGGEAACRNDYDMMIADCREKGKPTVAFVDGMCCSSGVNLACRCDRVIVMNPADEFGCIGTMAAFWAVAHDTVDQDGYRYVELVGKDCPEKNAWWREAAKGEYEKLQADLDRDTVQFHNTVREGRPLVTDDMLSGKVFEAREVIPALVDEIGNMERAIECVFQLADETMQAARFMTAEPGEDNPEDNPDGKEPEELAKLNAQQKAALGRNKEGMTIADDGHLLVEKEGLFGPYTEEVAKPQNDKDMTDEQKKAAEAEAAQAAEEQKPAEEQQPAGEQNPAGTEEATAAEGAPATEEEKPAGAAPADDTPSDETPAGDEKPADETPADEKPADEKPADETPAEETPAEEAPAEEQKPAGETLENAGDDVDKIKETLRGAEQMIADKDKEIADLKAAADKSEIDFKAKDAQIGQLQADVDAARKGLEEANGTIASKDEEIQKLKKQVESLKAEVKEFSQKEAPMVGEDAGVPAGNATGEAPKHKTSRIRRGMSYSQIREAMKDEK